MDHQPGPGQDPGIHPGDLPQPDHAVVLDPVDHHGHFVHMGHQQHHRPLGPYPAKYVPRRVPPGFRAHGGQLVQHFPGHAPFQPRGPRGLDQTVDPFLSIHSYPFIHAANTRSAFSWVIRSSSRGVKQRSKARSNRG